MFDWSELAPRPGVIVGVVNMTPDSFSDGGRYLDHDAAVAHGLELAAAGADVVDVGGESTRPGAGPVRADEERRRVVAVIRDLARASGVPVSVDTRKAAVAEAALDAGASVVNDVSAGLHDPAMLPLVAAAGSGYVAMHMKGTPADMQDDPRYDDVVAEVGAFLAGRVDAAVAAGVARPAILADPGIGFGKTVAHNLALLARLDVLAERSGARILVGTSRKAFLGRIAGAPDPSDRDDATLATVVWALDRGAAAVRVHSVAGAATAAALLGALRATGRAA